MLKKFFFFLAKRYRHSTVSKWAILGIDILTIVISFILIEVFRIVGGMDTYNDGILLVKLLSVLLISLFFFMMFGTFRGIIRHSGLHDIYKILMANVTPPVLIYLFKLFNNNYHFVHNRIVLSYSEAAAIYAVLTILMIGSNSHNNI